MARGQVFSKTAPGGLYTARDESALRCLGCTSDERDGPARATPAPNGKETDRGRDESSNEYGRE